MAVLATCLGFPRIGRDRELKKALESYWSGRTTIDDLEHTARNLRRRHWTAMKDAGLDHIPSNDFSLYDHVLDTAVMLGVVPERFASISDPARRYFAMARGLQDADTGTDVAALEMTKWFDTNYHYLVPELAPHQTFALDPSRILREIDEARATGVDPRPVVLGPVSFLLLSKLAHDEDGRSTIDLLDDLVATYERLLGLLAAAGIGWVQLDEPCLVTDAADAHRAVYERALARLARLAVRPKVVLATYFADLAPESVPAGFEALHVDLVRAPEQLDRLIPALGDAVILSLGVVDGRNVWCTDLDRAHALVRRAIEHLGEARVWIGPSCSLLHSPVDLGRETKLDAELREWLAFAMEKLIEIRALATHAQSPHPTDVTFERARAAHASRRRSLRVTDAAVRARLAAVDKPMLHRASPFGLRAKEQRSRLGLPMLPTTTIGSFPQTSDVRGARAAWRSGKLADEAYQSFLRDETQRCISRQEELDLDMLVHGEFERTDMVEHFGQLLAGFAFTELGWVQSYGSRCVKPPILFGDVSRPAPMTVAWSSYAQSLTKRIVKGMLTGPVTILQWSFVRDDQPRRDTAMQIALALRDEVADLEAAGIAAIQVDEPAIREGLPLRRRDREDYLRWAVEAFRLATSSVRDDTQIHTHMCYSEFGEIIDAIGDLDADVLSIETSRSRMELFVDFRRAGYPNEVGPGVYDIHSPRVPTTDEIYDLLKRAAAVLSVDRLWVNPDCGLKTRGWPEVQAALANMVEAAHRLRRDYTELRPA
ncbi:MAG: 5-methyltetrahydropteroyltriglutamate--homocysteine S-methyltransferase [Deltaproteobacteria bacterium]|nr:5-methyltetrahydropteroyltriglutamate--homocysteine S-methyltransferase [Deltaproteobacteria bacterium]